MLLLDFVHCRQDQLLEDKFQYFLEEGSSVRIDAEQDKDPPPLEDNDVESVGEEGDDVYEQLRARGGVRGEGA